MTESIRIAISGGGLAGASLVHALLQYNHLDVHIFESANEFKEAGAAIGCDILIGADGIHSTVRKIIPGEDDAAANPRNTGWWCIMALKPYEEARACLGDEYVDVSDASEYGWVGDGTFLMHNVLSEGSLVQFVVTGSDDTNNMSNQWNRMVAAEEVRKLYAEWPPRLRNAVEKLLCDKAEQPAIYLWEHPPARTYVSGPICVTGDAAHATTPWQGSGAGMSIEDSLILSTLLGQAKTPTQACAGLKIYDQIRRGRTQQVVESSRGTGVVLTGKGEDTGLELEKLRKNTLPRWDFIVDFDAKKHREEAVEMMVKEVGP
ncbi:salicylate hydroxylase [Apiospora aurea]|uniref:Salicylate hydroxylase n=1 Tax=Apiospora aurea TaxID=335848 RepID=A0ABR1QTL2_9PEZI